MKQLLGRFWQLVRLIYQIFIAFFFREMLPYVEVKQTLKHKN